MGIIHNNEKGFTLVELLVSMLIFAIGVAALTQTLLATMKGNSLGNKETAAITLAYHQIDELRGIDPNVYDTDSRLTPGTHTSTQNVVPNLFGGVSNVTAPAGYRISYTITNIVTPNPPLFYSGGRRVDVTVTWADPTTHSVTLSSIIAPNI